MNQFFPTNMIIFLKLCKLYPDVLVPWPGMAPSYIIDLINIKTNTRHLLRSNEGVLLKHPPGRMKKSFGDRSFSVARPLYGTLFLLASAASNAFLLLSQIFKLIFLN